MYIFLVTMAVCSTIPPVEKDIKEVSSPLRGDAFYGMETVIASSLGIIYTSNSYSQERRK